MRLEDAHVSSSPFDDVISGDQNRLRRAGSSIVIVVLVAFLLVGAFGLTELTGTESAKVGDTKIGVQYPKTIRAGNEGYLNLKFSGGKDPIEHLSVTVNEPYVVLFEDLIVYPTPDAQTTDGQGRVTFEFSPDSADSTVQFVGDISDQWQPTTTAHLEVEADGEQQQLEFTTWRVP
ncbi:MAG TPA: hypothetical protein H9884_03040 [Candidatus Yaniella excrementigallinarum]|nr:hypothetical protein [Candidatus Yaniella excrementigallinarum]